MELNFELSKFQYMFLTATQHIVFFGGGAGGGKTFAILADNLTGIHDPNYFSVFFRNTTTELDTDLWPKAKKMYYPFLYDENGRLLPGAKVREDTKDIYFPSGARSKFSYLELDKHGDSHYGAEYTRIYYDEFQKLSEYNFDVTRSRNRSMADVSKNIRCTLNPKKDHFVYNWIKPFLNDEGYSNPSLSGKTRYYLYNNGVLFTDWAKEKLETIHHKKARTYTYIPSLLGDNQKLVEMNPEYAATLDSMPEKKRKQLLLGCWEDTDDGGYYFKREWVLGESGEKATTFSQIPANCYSVRGIDKAYTAPHEGNKHPDFTAISPIVHRTSDGRYILEGSYHPDNICKRSPWDAQDPIYGQVRLPPGSRDEIILKQARMDGNKVVYAMAKDAGASVDFMSTVSKLISVGVRVKQDFQPSNAENKKVKDFEPFSSACQLGLVSIAVDTFPPDTLEYILTQLESFSAKKSTTTRKDDIVDAIALAFNTAKVSEGYIATPRRQLRVKSNVVKRKII